LLILLKRKLSLAAVQALLLPVLLIKGISNNVILGALALVMAMLVVMLLFLVNNVFRKVAKQMV
jgi:hypothetical protein